MICESPLLLIKQSNKKRNELLIDETPLSYEKMQSVLASLIEGNYSENINILSTTGDRYHYETEWSNNLKSNQQAKDFVEFVIEGHYFYTCGIEETRVIY